MFKIKKISILFLLVFLFFTSVCTANTALLQDSSSIPAVMDADAYIAGEGVLFDSTVNGNAFVFGDNVTIKGNIDGDLFVVGNTVTIDESTVISGNLFAAGSTISFHGKATSIYAIGQSFMFDTSASITRDIRAYVSQFTLKGTIGRNAYLSVGNIVIEESSQNLVQGNLEYFSSENLNIPETVVTGEIKFIPTVNNEPSVAEIISGYITSFVNVLVYAIAIVLVVTFLTPKFIDKATYCLEKKTFITAGIGILAFIVVPILSIFFIAIGYTMYVGVALLALYVLALSMTISILGIAVGNFIANRFKNKTKGKTILFSLASVIVIWLLQLIPTLGTWISVFTVVFGFGILVFSLFIKKEVSELISRK